MSKLAQLSPTQAKPTVKVAELIVKEDELSYEQIFQFVKQHAGGNEGNVNIVPLPNVDLDNKKPVPFGYGGKKDGVRAKIQNMILKGIKGDHTLKTMLDVTCKMFGHSKKKPCVLHALMHGGYSPSSKFWLTPYVKLVVKS